MSAYGWGDTSYEDARAWGESEHAELEEAEALAAAMVQDLKATLRAFPPTGAENECESMCAFLTTELARATDTLWTDGDVDAFHDAMAPLVADFWAMYEDFLADAK